MERLYTTDEWEGLKDNHAPITLVKEKSVKYKSVEIAEMDLNNQIMTVRQAIANNVAVTVPYHNVIIVIEPCCVDCNCRDIPVGWDMCEDLNKKADELNTPIEALKKATFTVFKELAWSALYRAYCLNKNVIASLCWLTNEVRSLRR